MFPKKIPNLLIHKSSNGRWEMKLKKILLLIIFLNFHLTKARDEFGTCDYFQKLTSSSQFTITSPGYPSNYTRNAKCRWTAEAPPGFKISLNCIEVQIPCGSDNLSIIAVGSSDPKRYCGKSPFQVDSTSYRVSIALQVGNFSSGGKFRCVIKSMLNNCSCGTRNRGRIGNVIKCN